MQVLDCSHNSLESLDVSEQQISDRLECSHNLLSSLVLGRNEMYKLNCSYNKLKNIDVSGLHAMKVLICEKNGLDILDLRMINVICIRKDEETSILKID